MTLPPEVRVAWRRIAEGEPRRSTSRALLRELLPGASFASRCPRCGGDHGRVHVTGRDAAVSVSYAAGWAVVAVDAAGRRIGVDAVAADAGGLERVLPVGQGAREWARIEAVLKADGRGVTVDPSRVHLDRENARGADWTARVDDGTPLVGWDVPGPPGVRVSVARG